MVSDSTRLKLKEAALKNKLGGDNTVQRPYTKNELTDLISACIKLDCVNTFVSLFSGITYTTLGAWKNDVGRHLLKNDRLYFYYNIDIITNGVKICEYCNIVLDIMSYDLVHKFDKYCPDCTSKGVWRKNYTPEQLDARGRKISSSKLAFYKTDKGKEVAETIGEKNSINMTNFHQSEKGIQTKNQTAIKLSDIMKQKILDGSFTPNIKNSRTHFQVEYRGHKFRSSWECMWFSLFPALLYETVRVPYVYNGKTKIYIVDFEDKVNKILYEIKPTEHLNDSVFLAKKNAAEQWAQNNGYAYTIISQHDLILHKDVLLNSDIPTNVKSKLINLCKK